MPKQPIAFADLRSMLTLANELMDLRGDFQLRFQRLLGGLAKIVEAQKITAFDVTEAATTGRVVPIMELREATGGAWRRTRLAGIACSHLTLTTMSRAARVVTAAGIPTWMQDLHCQSMLRQKHTLQSVQYDDDDDGGGGAVGLLIERALGQPAFTDREAEICDAIWRSFPVGRRSAEFSVKLRGPQF